MKMKLKVGTTVEYRQKSQPKHNFLRDAVILRHHDNGLVDLYVLPKNEPVNIGICGINKEAYVINGEQKQERFNVDYSNEPVPGTWGYKE